MKYMKSFIAGFISTLIFHQGILNILNILGVGGSPAYSLKPTWPFSIPSVLSVALFGGLWGIALLSLVDHERAEKYWLKSFLFGAIAPTLVALFIVFPLKGLQLNLRRAMIGIMLNGAWGLGTAWIALMMEYKARKIHTY